MGLALAIYPRGGLRVLVGVLNPFVVCVFKFRDITENASSHALARDLGDARSSIGRYLEFYNTKRPQTGARPTRRVSIRRPNWSPIWRRREFSAVRWTRLRSGYALPASPQRAKPRREKNPAGLHLSFAGILF